MTIWWGFLSHVPCLFWWVWSTSAALLDQTSSASNTRPLKSSAACHLKYNDLCVLYKFCLAFSSNSAVEICLPEKTTLDKCQFHWYPPLYPFHAAFPLLCCGQCLSAVCGGSVVYCTRWYLGYWHLRLTCLETKPSHALARSTREWMKITSHCIVSNSLCSIRMKAQSMTLVSGAKSSHLALLISFKCCRALD